MDLYKHNKDAYQNAVCLLKTKKKAAIIHPTGTGKSFVAFKLCEDNPNKKVCWLSPSEYIFNTQIENLKKTADGTVPQNIDFFTYAKLMKMADTELAEIKPDFIILDEFHRCGAEMWGLGVQALLSMYSDVPVLGLSATAIRYLDNQRDMSDELFDGNIASEMTLGEAIVRGILAPPKYVLSAFSRRTDLDKYKKRINRAKSRAVRDKGEKYLEELRRTLENADGTDVIFDKHMTERTGKYIVFCSDYKHLVKMRALAGEWFCRVDKNPHIYSFYTEDASADAEFTAFKNDNDDTHLRLLYCIDALNEGVHVDDVSGVILLRPTVSPIVYKQQIGRALQTGITRSSVIFDIVTNIENLYSIGSVEEEMRLAVSYYRSHGMESSIVNEHFQIIDEVKDCLEIFEKLNETLTASWEIMYFEAKKFYEENGHLNVPKRYKTENGYSLGSWIMTQRSIYAGNINGLLTKERIDRLGEIGMVWESSRDLQWNRCFEAAKKYFAEHGDLKVPSTYVTQNGVKLGNWISNLRTAYKNNFTGRYLTGQRVKALEEIGMIWDTADYVWQRYYGACLTYYGTNGNLDIPSKYVTADGLRLGTWINQIRGAYNKTNGNYRLSDEQIRLLEEIGMIWDKKQDIAWNTGYAEAEKYYKRNGNLKVPVNYTSSAGYALGKWIDRQRRNVGLSDERKSKLDALGMVWKKTDLWDTRYALAEKYYRENGNLNINADYVTEGVWLGKWLNKQRKLKNGGALAADKIDMLNKIGIDWMSPLARKWENYFSACEEYYFKYGNTDIPANYTDKSGMAIGRWIKSQRANRSKLKLNGENGNQIKRLEGIGVKLNASM